jgi:uncharacterized repeat protein (TIGR02543 family)
VVRLIGVPLAGKYFSRWFNFMTGPTGNPFDFTVTTPSTNLSAFFANLPANHFTLTVLLNGSGTVTRSPSTNALLNGTNVTLTAVPDAGQVFVGWSGDASGTSTQTNVLMNTNKTVTANFTLAPSVALTERSRGKCLSGPPTFL